MILKKPTFCNNCGKLGHLFHQCKIPITSIGVIAFRKVDHDQDQDQDIEILLIRRKDSIAFVDFMRGKYNLEDEDYIINLFNKMTIKEREMIKVTEFEWLWNYLWGSDVAIQYVSEERLSYIKFNKLKTGYRLNSDIFNLEIVLEKCTTVYLEPEWGFPKGRRNYQERDIICGLREFEEETGYNRTNINILTNIYPFEEIYTGSNYKSYKHKYFLGYMRAAILPEKEFQVYEIGKIQWVKISNAASFIRDYNYEKKIIIYELNTLFKNYKLYI